MFKKLRAECQELVKEAELDPDKMYEVGEALIDGSEGFTQNTELGIRYLENSANEGCEDAITYYGRLLIGNEIIPQDVEKAKSVLTKSLDSGNSLVSLLYGKAIKKEGDTEAAKKYFEKAAKSGNAEAMYELGKLYYKGLGCSKSEKDAMRYFTMAKKNGFSKSDNFLLKHKKQDNEAAEPPKAEETKEDPVQAIKKEADSGNDEACAKYGLMLFNGEGVPANKAEAVPYIKKAADSGDVNCIYSYALFLFKGLIVPENKLEAIRYYKMSADKGNIEAASIYGIMLYNGDGIPANKNEAVPYIKKAADKGNVKSMAKYGIILRDGDGVPANRDEALKYLKMAADAGDIDSMAYYSYLYIQDDNIYIHKRRECVVEYMKKAADKGSAPGNYYFGLLVYKCDNLILDVLDKSHWDSGLNYGEKSAPYIKKAADMDYTPAIALYGKLLKYGNAGDGKVDRKAASVYLKKASDRGDLDAMAEYGDLLIKDPHRTPLTIAEAVRHVKQSADKGNVTGLLVYAYMLRKGIGMPVNGHEAARIYKDLIQKDILMAMNNYGDMLQYGEGTQVNLEEALKYYEMAARRSLPIAEYNYGKMLYDGKGTIRDRGRGRDFMERAAKSECPEAMYEVGFKYFLGAFDNDPKKGVYYLRKAALKENVLAMYEYGYVLRNGRHVEQNKEEAANYFRKAVEFGCKEAMHDLGDMLIKGDGIPCNLAEGVALLRKYDPTININDRIRNNSNDSRNDNRNDDDCLIC